MNKFYKTVTPLSPRGYAYILLNFYCYSEKEKRYENELPPPPPPFVNLVHIKKGMMASLIVGFLCVPQRSRCLMT